MAILFIGFVCFLLLVQSSSSQDCGRYDANLTDVEKSVDAEENAWPWMVAIIQKYPGVELGSPLCNGFLIDNQHVLTSGECIGRTKPDRFALVIGNIDTRKGQKYGIKSLHAHPGYRHRGYFDNIALLTLDRAVSDTNVIPICLPRNKEFMNVTGMETIVAGWAMTSVDMLPTTYTLKQLNAGPVINNRNCEHAFGIAPYNGSMCAGFMEEGKHVFCYGIAGSPLMLKTDQKWYAIGIASIGIKCSPEYPTGYTTVRDYLSWIDRVREEEELDPVN